MDATASFQYLVDNVLTWKQSVDDLQTYIRQKYDERADDYEQHLDESQPKRRKSASMASLHSDDDNSNRKPLSRQAQRQRRPRGSIRSNASGHQRFRSRRNVVIFYDSHIQSELDKLVKSYGVARNNLRKGKNAYVASHGFGLPALRRQHHNASSSSPRTGSKPATQLSKSATVSVVVAVDPVSDPLKDVTVFARADQQMQFVQDLCEKAAHQIIREGDCKMELEKASQGLQTLFSVAESMLDALKQEEQRQEQESTDDGDMFSTLSIPAAAKTYRRPSLTTMSVLPKVQEPQVSPCLPGTIASLVSAPAVIPSVPIQGQAIEVDEDEESGDDYIDVAISNYRSCNMRRLAV